MYTKTTIRLYETPVRVALGIFVIVWLNAMQFALHLEERAELELRYQERTAVFENYSRIVSRYEAAVKHLAKQNELLRDQNDALTGLDRMAPSQKARFVQAVFELVE